MHSVERWFGDGFSQLHPLLQQLHRQGGNLQGKVDLRLGNGLAGLLGRRLAGRLGIPLEHPQVEFKVMIHSNGETLHWDRYFATTTALRSTFHPHGYWPAGYWLETTGALRLALAVDIHAGGWYWRPIKAWLHDVRVPLWLLPRTSAYKRIDNGRYHFHVGFALPLLGTLFSYSGTLSLSDQ